MSTLTGENKGNIVESEKDLEGYFSAHAKAKDAMLVGLEVEFFMVCRKSGRAICYEEPGGIEDLLRALSERYEYEPMMDGNHIIGLHGKHYAITLEPGGQIELSAPPVKNVFEIEDQIHQFRQELTEIRKSQKMFHDKTWIAVGVQPFSSAEEISWVPKQRYGIMADYFGKRGSLSHHMMKRTATNQVNFDYFNEKHAMSNLRVALSLTSIVSALFANSSFSEGKTNDYQSLRHEIWIKTDPQRTGLLYEFIRPNKTFEDYLNYVLEAPVIFIVRKGKWISVIDLSFRQFIKDGFQGEKATLGDFELHLSTLFPEVRLKQYLEVRGADCQSPDLIPAVAAFWKGILYDEQTRDQAWAFVADWTLEERQKLHMDVARHGLKSMVRGTHLKEIAGKLVELSCQSLAKQNCEDEARNECLFLDRIRTKLVRIGRSPSEIFIDKWRGEWLEDPEKLVQALSIELS